MVTNNHTSCGLAQEAATNQKASNNNRLLKDWYRFHDIRRIYLTAEEMSTLHDIAKAKAGWA